MRTTIRKRILAASLLLLASAASAQQSASPVVRKTAGIDLAVTYHAERAQIAPGHCACFWMEGGGAEAALALWKGWGVAAGLSGGHASNVTPHVDVNKLDFLAGPRYTWSLPVRLTLGKIKPPVQIFGQGLFGYAYGFNGVYPTTAGAVPSASSFALRAGGGFNLRLTPRLGVRLLEADYERTALPNNASNTQNNLLIAAGLTWRFARR